MIHKIVIALCALSLIVTDHSISSNKTTTIETPVEGLDAMIHEALDTFDIPGAAIGIVIDGEVVLTKGYGLRDIDNNLPVTKDTLFAIGSCTKAFTTHVLGQLVDEGKISWEDPVIKHLPEFQLKDEYATSHITIRDLLTHQTGLPRHDHVWYHADLLHRLQFLDSSADLRGKFQYNNLMYVVAGLVIEKITGQTWEEAVQSRILVPLEMDRTNFCVLDSQKEEDFSFPFRNMSGFVQSIPFYNQMGVGPAGAINSSVTDMVKWLKLQLSDGTCNGHLFLKKETLQAMHTPEVSLRNYFAGLSDFFGYGLGWKIGFHDGRYFVAHAGGIDGFTSFTSFLPQEKIGIVVLTNSENMTLPGHLTQAILDLILGTPKEDWIQKAKSAPQEKTEDAPCVDVGTSYPPDDYIGSFEHPAYGLIQLQKVGDGLVLSYHDFIIPLSHRCYDHFTGEWRGLLNAAFHCSFTRDHFGVITAFTMPMDPSVDAITFKRKTKD